MQTFSAVVAILATITSVVAADGTLSTFSKTGCKGTKVNTITKSGIEQCITITGSSFSINNPNCIAAAFQTADCDGMAVFNSKTDCNNFISGQKFLSVFVNCKKG